MLAVERYRVAGTARLGVTTTESQALSYLIARGAMGLTDLAHALEITTGTATTMIDRLERNGLARRTPHDTDRRRVTVELTARGRRVAEETTGWLEALVRRVAPDDPDAFAALVHRLAEAFEYQAGAVHP